MEKIEVNYATKKQLDIIIERLSKKYFIDPDEEYDTAITYLINFEHNSKDPMKLL